MPSQLYLEQQRLVIVDQRITRTVARVVRGRSAGSSLGTYDRTVSSGVTVHTLLTRGLTCAQRVA